MIYIFIILTIDTTIRDFLWFQMEELYYVHPGILEF